ADRNRSHWSTSKTPSYTKSVSWQHHPQRRITGMNVAANIFVIKLGVAVGGAILGWILAYFHYAANTTVQSASAVQGVVLLFTLVPSVFYVLTAVSIKFYGLTENRMNGIVDDLKHGTFAES
ncbi:MFS transporter, partial [Klebsiella pneumoniae]|uniref:MFS transporter n=1 Tax=Klebsiella pneumoniae TaxID=573 RepID=UPI001F5B7EFD